MSGSDGEGSHTSNSEDDDHENGLFECAEDVGFVGETNLTYVKMYAANVSETNIEGMYFELASKITVKCITLAGNPSLKASFFEERRSFSDFNSAALFTPKVIDTNITLFGLLNFIPNTKFEEFLQKSENMTRRQNQRYLLGCFVSAYKSFRSAMFDQQDITISSEEGDVRTLIKMSLAFGPSSVRAMREVTIDSAMEGAPLPHGNIDLLVYAADKRGMVVAMKSGTFSSERKDVGELTATAVKTKLSFPRVGSDRQCIMELLALSEVLKLLNEDNEFVVLLKACRECFQPYIYFTKCDVLITTDEISLYDSQLPCPVAFFVYYLMLNRYINLKVLSVMNIKMPSGWGEAFNDSKLMYLPSLSPQQHPRKPKRKRKAAEHKPSKVFKQDVPFSDLVLH